MRLWFGSFHTSRFWKLSSTMNNLGIKSKWIHWLLAPVLLVAIYLSALNLVSTYFLLENYKRESLWSLGHLIAELEATQYETQLYVAGANDLKSLQLRYDVLWSRLPVSLNSLEKDDMLGQVQGLYFLVSSVFEHVKAMEPDLYTNDIDPQRLLRWASILKQDSNNMNQYLIHEVTDADGEYSHAAWGKLLKALSLLSSVVLAFIVYLGSSLYFVMRERAIHQFMLDHDSLTGVASRDHIMGKIKEYCRTKTPCTLVAFDLNKFKQVNDTHGHMAGDEILIYLAKQFTEQLSEIGLVGRIGGDEFLWLCHTENQHRVDRYHARLIEALKAPYQYGDIKIPVRVSTGGAKASEVGFSVTGLLEEADAMMYQAKGEQLKTICWQDQPSHLEVCC